jgi:hypothetical protein
MAPTSSCSRTPWSARRPSTSRIETTPLLARVRFVLGVPDASQPAAGLRPDVLDYDASNSEGYPNGRRLSDDILDLRSAEMTMGKVRVDGVGPHSDRLDEFPYLGAPHRASER